MIDLDNAYLHMLVEFDYVERMGDTAICHLGDMDESVLMDTDIDKGPEVRDIRDNAWQDHALHEVIDGGDILVELELLQLFARVAPWFLQFLDDIRKGGDAHLGCDILFNVDGLALLLIINKVCDGTALILGHLFDDGITLRVDG